MDKKQEIINAYLLGDRSFRQLAQQYKIGTTTIHRWVMNFQGRSYAMARESKTLTLPVMKRLKVKEDLSQEVAALQKELSQERLRTKLLTAMIDIAEEKLKIHIRKKYDTKPLKK